MEYITSQNSAGQSMDGCVQTSETSAACQQQQQQQQWDADAGSRVKLMVERLLSRLGLSALASLVDETAAAAGTAGDGGDGGRADVGVDVHVLRTQSRAADDDDDDQDQLLEQVGRSFGVLLQLLRRCTNWNDLLSADASLSDAVARLTEHELSGGAMGYGVQTDWSVRRLTSVLAVSSACAGPADTPPLTAASSSSSLSSCDAVTTLAQQQQQLVAGAERRDVDELATRHRRRSVELQSTADTSSCRCADIGAALTSCAARLRPAVNRCCRVDQLYNEQACDNDEPFRVDSTQCSDMSPLSRPTTEN